MSKCYIAGPMRGLPELNFPAFDKAAALGRSLGWTVISPAEMDRAAGDTPEATGPIEAGGGSPAFIRRFVRRDTTVLIETLRAEEGDAIALLPGWDRSEGGMGEVGLGKWLKLAVLDATNFRPLDVRLHGVSIGAGLASPLPAEFQVCHNPRSVYDDGEGRLKCDPECGCGPPDYELLIRQEADRLANVP